VDDLNKNISSLEGKRGPSSKYTLPAEGREGKLEITFDPLFFEGIACSLDSVGYKYVSRWSSMRAPLVSECVDSLSHLCL
jgi:acetylornithine deacetylase